MKKTRLKVYLKRIIGIILFFSISIGVVSFLQANPTHGNYRIKGFYMEPKDSLDVVIIGASDVFAGYSAGYAYERFGFTSYPYAIDSNPFELFEYEIDEVFSRQSPELVVVELTTVGQLASDLDNNRFDVVLHELVDNMPISNNKSCLINRYGIKDEWLSYYLPFIAFHNKRININDGLAMLKYAIGNNAYLKGMTTQTKFDTTPELDYERGTKERKMSKQFENNVVSFLDHCKEKGYRNIVFTRFPHKITNEKTKERYENMNFIKSLIISNGYNYIDCDEDLSAIGIDSQEDFYNNDHLNTNGSKKLTEYLGNIFLTKYKLKPMKQSNEVKTRWEQVVEYTNAYYEYCDGLLNEGKEEDVWEKDIEKLKLSR